MRLCARLPKKPGRCPGFICQSAPKVPKNNVFDTFAAYGRVIYMRRETLTVSLHTSLPSATIGCEFL